MEQLNEQRLYEFQVRKDTSLGDAVRQFFKDKGIILDVKEATKDSLVFIVPGKPDSQVLNEELNDLSGLCKYLKLRGPHYDRIDNRIIISR